MATKLATFFGVRKMEWQKLINNVPADFANQGSLQLVAPGETMATWEGKRATIKKKWQDFLGYPPFTPFLPKYVEGEWEEGDIYKGRSVYIQTEPDYYEKTYLLIPKKLKPKNAAVLVFYYDIDTMIGEDRGGKHFMNTPNRFFARELVKRGFVVQVMRWFYQGFGNEYLDGVARIKKLYPKLKGLGKIAFDANRVLDYLTSLPYVDTNAIGAMGHSLGGKMALYATAFDQRIKATVVSELGIGLSYCNWDAPWYLGAEIKEPGFDLDNHQILGLIAPRPLLLIAGDFADSNKSWYYINTAKKVYALFGREDYIGLYNHHNGHDPEKKAMDLSYMWLQHYLQFNGKTI